jgi:hypothetical protein
MCPYKNPLLRPVALIAFLVFFPFTLLHSEEGVQVSGYFFGDAYGFISHQNPEVTGQTGVWFRRVYLNFEKKWDPFTFLLRFELNSPDSAISYARGVTPAGSDSLRPYLKNLALSYNFSQSQNLSLGIIPTPTWNRIEKEWGYRPVEKTPLDLAKWGSAVETGLSLAGTFLEKALSYHLLGGNGNGLRSESDKGKVVMLSLASEPIEGLLLEVYGDYNDKPDIKNDSFTLQGFAQYKTDPFRVGVQYDFVRVIGTPGNATRVRLASLYAVFSGESVSFYLRGDRFFDPNPKAKDIEYIRLDPKARYTLLLAGLDLPVAKNISVLPNIEGVIYDKPEKGEKPKPVSIARLTLFVRF